MKDIIAIERFKIELNGETYYCETKLMPSGAFQYGNQTCMVVTINDGAPPRLYDTRYEHGCSTPALFHDWVLEFLKQTLDPRLPHHPRKLTPAPAADREIDRRHGRQTPDKINIKEEHTMPAEIKQIVGRRWTYPGERRANQSYTVYYASGKRVQYGTHQNLPANILRYILEADSAETTYHEGWTNGASYTVAKTVYTKATPEETKPKAKREKPVRVYSVLFYTQRNRVLANWEYLAAATNQKQAVEQAREKWYAVRNEHMFNCRAERIDKIPEDRELYTFKTLNTKWATWGYRG